MRKKQRILCLFLSVCMVFVCMTGLNTTALADGPKCTNCGSTDTFYDDTEGSYFCNSCGRHFVQPAGGTALTYSATDFDNFRIIVASIVARYMNSGDSVTAGNITSQLNMALSFANKNPPDYNSACMILVGIIGRYGGGNGGLVPPTVVPAVSPAEGGIVDALYANGGYFYTALPADGFEFSYWEFGFTDGNDRGSGQSGDNPFFPAAVLVGDDPELTALTAVFARTDEPEPEPRPQPQPENIVVVPTYVPPSTPAAVSEPEPEPETQTVPEGILLDVTDATGNADDAVITGTADDLADAVLDDSDRSAMASGEDVHVYLKVEEIIPTEAEQALIYAAVGQSADNAAIALCLDIDLFKQVGNDAAVQITETNGMLEISIDLPDEFVNDDPGIERSFFVARIHDGLVDIIPADYDPDTGKLTFLTDKFSMYIIGFVDTKLIEELEAEDDVLMTDPEFVEPDENQPVQNADVQSADEANPHTGAELPGLAVLALSAAAAAFASGKRTK